MGIFGKKATPRPLPPTEGELDRAARRSDRAYDREHEKWHARRRATGDPGGINYDSKRR